MQAKAETMDLIRKCVVGNATEIIRRFREFGIGDDGQTFLPWSLFELLNSSKDVTAPERCNLLRSLRENACPDDGFSKTFLAWFKTDLDACVAADGRMDDNLAYNFLAYLDEVIIGDVQAIESQNSVLRIMTTRARCILRDLLSSRHVIRHSEKSLVTAERYTSELKSDAQIIAKRRVSHDRFQAIPLADVMLPK